MIRLAAPYRWRPLSSNVRQHQHPLRFTMRVPRRFRGSAPRPSTPVAVPELEPSHFRVNDAWLVLKASALPFMVEGQPCDVYVLQDAASMYLFGSVFAPCAVGQPRAQEVGALFKRAWDKGHQWPQKLLLPESVAPLRTFAAAAQRRGVPVEVLPDGALAVYITDVQAAFHEHFSGGGSAA